jgi:maltooligosyltrehalose trehalohydrolase
MKRSYSMPFGAEVCDGSVRFRLWAPKAKKVDVLIEQPALTLPMSSLGNGWFELITAQVSAGARYRFQINGTERVPDIASRYQPEDVHGPSQIVDPSNFDWQDENWRGRSWNEAVIYELHVGTFTPEGTFSALQSKLDYLVNLGVTAIELMPLSDFPGTRNWGYDGVLPFAPDSSYGTPEDLKQLIQSAHAKGLMILLDVVYNHFGPEGNYIRTYAPDFFTDRHCTPWGDGINFDGLNSRIVREYFIHNALFWLEEYHFDGLRLDAVHAIADDSQPHILTEIAEKVRDTLGTDRHIHLVLENDDNASRFLQREGDCAVSYNAQWNDDFHHAFHVLVTGETDGYYVDYAESPIAHIARCLSEGFDYQGQSSRHRGDIGRGEPSRHLPPLAFVSFLQNHDQVGNRAFGERIHEIADLEALKAALAIFLLAPQPPLLFMGEEFAASSPFLYFCAFKGDLAEAVCNGRRAEFARFTKFSSPETRASIPDPNDRATFERSKLEWDQLRQPEHARWLEFYRRLLEIRRSTIVPHLQGMTGNHASAVRTETTLFVDWVLGDRSILRLLANLSDTPSMPLTSAIGETIYTTRPGFSADKPMEPWSVAWFLQG